MRGATGLRPATGLSDKENGKPAAGSKKHLSRRQHPLLIENEQQAVSFRRCHNITVRPFDVSDKQTIPFPVVSG